MKKKLVCSGCRRVLAEIAQDSIASFGFGIKKTATGELLAVCTDCKAETPMDPEIAGILNSNRR
jgi:hypothetical protein